MQYDSLKFTPLHEQHKKLGAKLVLFAGWEMPVWYTSGTQEHVATRTHAGLFDVSHMGEIFITGAQAEKAVDYLTCNNVGALYDGRAQYSAITNHQGGTVDDVIIYRFSPTKYLLCVNASNARKDFDWLTKHNTFNAVVTDHSPEFGQIAIQGPKAINILSKLAKSNLLEIKYFHFREQKLLGHNVIFARTGYTGEDGFELFVPSAATAEIWNALLEVGQPDGLIPCGLAARDSLRLEACLPLHGHELADDISVIESGLNWVVKIDKGEFIGREVLAEHKKYGAARTLVGFEVVDPGIARHADKVYSEFGVEIGSVTSGTKTPTLNRSIGMALVAAGHRQIDAPLFIEVRGKKLKSRVAKIPFYKQEIK